ncbi:acyltransferase domain-containing protein [Granulicella sp. S190]|uniref:acyltransferase domain-containing protein n=1 Tax=Granulicella sp. S190 TaxID=1747226 RepID=UPI001C201839|nr:acyltransferase domain-containing protein [Granulicella sp. S190]
MFSGQGSQYFDMGRELYEDNPTFRYWMDRLDLEHRRLQGISILEILYRSGYKRSACFDQLQLTHPAIFILEYSLAQALYEAGVEPDVVVGSSLGIFAAAAVAGVLPVQEALASVVQHARNVELTCDAGCMIAVLAPIAAFTASGLARCSELAAINADSHFVISSTVSAVGQIERILTENSLTYQRLPVHFAFHSRWIERSAPIKNQWRRLSFRSPQVPLFCCAKTRVLTSISADDLWDVTRMPIRFRDSILGLEALKFWHYVDVGPSGTLATFTRYISSAAAKESRIHKILSPLGGDREGWSKVIAVLGPGH